MPLPYERHIYRVRCVISKFIFASLIWNTIPKENERIKSCDKYQNSQYCMKNLSNVKISFYQYTISPSSLVLLCRYLFIDPLSGTFITPPVRCIPKPPPLTVSGPLLIIIHPNPPLSPFSTLSGPLQHYDNFWREKKLDYTDCLSNISK
jgi:hypothetical protein